MLLHYQCDLTNASNPAVDYHKVVEPNQYKNVHKCIAEAVVYDIENPASYFDRFTTTSVPNCREDFSMATAAVQHSPVTPSGGPIHIVEHEKKAAKRHDVATTLYYYKEAEDGSPPAPTYVGYVFRLRQ